jgi:hypothetical protein
LYDQTRQAAHDRQIRNQRGELRTKLPDDLIRQRRLRHMPASATASVMAAIFGDVRFDRWQFGDLMASRVAHVVACLQAALARRTRVRDQIHDHVHSLGGDQRPRVARMAGLPARLAAALAPTAAHPLLTGESVRRWWLRGNRGVLVAQRQLTFEIGDLLLGVSNVFGRLRQLPLTLGQFAAESFVLSFQPLFGLRAASSLRLRHALHGTPIRLLCTDP